MTDTGWQRGRAAEQRAAEFLRRQGLELIYQNYHCVGGEVDIIAIQACWLIFVEVRRRTGRRWGDAIESVGPTKRARWLRAAGCFCASHPEFDSWDLRFDLVAMQGEAQQVIWLQNVLQCSDSMAFTLGHHY